MITLHGQTMSKDQRLGNCSLDWLLNLIQQTEAGLPWRHEGSSAGISNIQSYHQKQSSGYTFNTTRAHTDTDFNVEVLVSQYSQSSFKVKPVLLV